MKQNNQIGKILITIFSLFTLIALSFAVMAAINPSAPTSISAIKDVYGPGGLFTPTMQNDSRGYVYVINIDESQPTYKWKGYVGNITGEYALLDNSSNSLFDWDIATTTGEVYATKIAGGASGTAVQWTDLECLSFGNITIESYYLNHSNASRAQCVGTGSDGATPANCTAGINATNARSEDSYEYTWKTDTDTDGAGIPAFNNTQFYAGDTLIAARTCYGTYLNQNNSDVSAGGTADWEQVLLTDGTSEIDGPLDSWRYLRYDVIYAALIENNTYGFNNKTYDFQLLLPEYGLETATPELYQIAYYFYIELI